VHQLVNKKTLIISRCTECMWKLTQCASHKPLPCELYLLRRYHYTKTGTLAVRPPTLVRTSYRPMITARVKSSTLHATRACGEVEVMIHSFLTSALYGGEWSASGSGRFTYGGESPEKPMYRRLSGLQRQYGRFRERKSLLPQTQIEPPSITRIGDLQSSN
jgi:hypothetical protein